MIPIEEAWKLVLSSLPPRRSEEVPFQSALGRVLAVEIAATSDIPPFDRAAMDGYAVLAADLSRAPADLTLSGEVRAGGGTPGVMGTGEAFAIMTGAPVPQGADAVVMVEQTSRTEDGRRVIFQQTASAGQNIAPRGSEARAGEIVLEAGRVIGPPELAVLATFGFSRVQVYRRPEVALLATGDELVEVEQKPEPDQIRNSNAWSLSGQLRLLGIVPDYLGIARDDKQDLHRLLREGLKRDVLILTGGVSMGEYDFVKQVFEELELEILFTKVAMKPGKPTVFARKGDRLVFGLPGNPVSTFVAFENFVRPALGRMCGFPHPELPRVRGVLQREMKQAPGRTAFLPARVSWKDGWLIDPLPWKGSADIIGFSRANATVIFPGERARLDRGELVEAMLLADFFQRIAGAGA